MLKQQIINSLNETLEKKINLLKAEIEALNESRNSDTKSSAGDKFETSREMAQLELHKFEGQLANLLNQKKDLQRIDVSKTFSNVELGSLVTMGEQLFFISIGMGLIKLGSLQCIVISPASPLGKTMLDKRVGEKFEFQKKAYSITAIV